MSDREAALTLTVRWLAARLTSVRLDQVSDDAIEAMIRQAAWEKARFADELVGLRKANALLLAGMESQAELMDSMKQELRRVHDDRAGNS